jgi:3-isopropylmalate/(R)-2-methylmalate dehydratase small subunit
MEKFIRLEGIAAPMPRDNIDTDAVIPVPWMKSIRPDYARALFANWRWKDSDGVTEVEGFVLNRAPFRHASILVAGDNFGCGSSREAAVWALSGFGIRCVLASSFGDIFYENSFKNGLLPLVQSTDSLARLHAQLAQGVGGCRMTVDLVAQTMTQPDGTTLPFTIDAGRRQALLAGLDEIGETLLEVQQIAAFEARDRVARPWIYDPPLDR